MIKNIGRPDQIIRLILGLVILAAGAYFQCWLALFGIVPIATALSGWCPAYGLCKISSK